VKIAYVVDVHNRLEAVPRALASIGTLDVLVVGGDITTFGTPEDAERAITLWRPLATHLLAVAGNMDSPEIDERIAELRVSIAARGVTIGDVGFAGASASPRSPLHTPYEVEDREFAASAALGLAEIAACRIRVLCPHAPPYGTACDRLRSGEHVGSRALRELVEQAQPDLVLCGHIHESRGEDRVDATRVFNPGPVANGHFALVEVNETVSVTLR
jgi:Icc-related predicted phosphoesterase